MYSGCVDVISEDVDDFRKAFESLQIEFNREDEDETEAGDNKENDDNWSAAAMCDQDFKNLIDIKEPAWNNVLIKDEPIDEEHLKEPIAERPSNALPTTKTNVPKENHHQKSLN